MEEVADEAGLSMRQTVADGPEELDWSVQPAAALAMLLSSVDARRDGGGVGGLTASALGLSTLVQFCWNA